LVCLVGFLRSGHRPFALVALVAIGAVAPLGFQAARSYSHTAARPVVAYGGDYRAEIELGVCEVSIPPGHEPGMLESPNLLKLEVQQDVGKHVVLTSVEQLSKDRFFKQLHSRMDADGKNILVFIHGYNVSFEDAARRTAQMAADSQFPGAPVFYSWPSQANWYGYMTDKENIELSVTQIKAFLLDLAAKSGATTINLVAHSMGNVGLTEALKEMDGISPQPMFNQVVLAAPDIDADIFKNRVAPYIVTKAQHVTLYTSQTDLALIASRYFNSGPRVGDSGPGVLLFPGIDTIDATAVDSSLLGHSYYGSNVSVLTDLGRVLQNQPIASRQYLRTVIDSVQPYWAFDPLRLSQNPASGSPR
ncbi:MAG: alpha/beta hydrolase, partial [Aureliella sp.]